MTIYTELGKVLDGLFAEYGLHRSDVVRIGINEWDEVDVQTNCPIPTIDYSEKRHGDTIHHDAVILHNGITVRVCYLHPAGVSA